MSTRNLPQYKARLTHKRPAGKVESPEQLLVYRDGTPVLKVFVWSIKTCYPRNRPARALKFFELSLVTI
jgi:hypothetical protein